MQLEAQKWRAGIRSGEVRCLCREHARRDVPVDLLGHIAVPGHVCLWEYAVSRIYELERQLGL